MASGGHSSAPAGKSPSSGVSSGVGAGGSGVAGSAVSGSSAKTSKSKSEKAGLVFPVGRVTRHLKAGRYAKRIGAGAPIFLAAVLEYLTAEVLELSANIAKDHGRARITPRYVQLAVRADDELNQLLGKVIIASGGVCSESAGPSSSPSKKKKPSSSASSASSAKASSRSARDLSDASSGSESEAEERLGSTQFRDDDDGASDDQGSDDNVSDGE